MRGYTFDVQIVTAPVTDGSLSSCPPAEAVTWGKVDKDTYQQTTESMQADYSMVMPFLVKALLDNRARYARWARGDGRGGAVRASSRKAARLPAPAGRATGSSSSARRCAGGCSREVRDNGEWLQKSLAVPAARSIR